MKVLANNLGSQNSAGPVLVGRAFPLASSGTGILPVILISWAERPCHDVVRGRATYEESSSRES